MNKDTKTSKSIRSSQALKGQALKTQKIIDDIKKKEEKKVGKKALLPASKVTKPERYSIAVQPMYGSLENSSQVKVDIPESEAKNKAGESILFRAKREVLKEHLNHLGDESRKRSPTLKDLNIHISSPIQNLLDGERSPKVISIDKDTFIRNISKSPESVGEVFQSKTYGGYKNTKTNIKTIKLYEEEENKNKGDFDFRNYDYDYDEVDRDENYENYENYDKFYPYPYFPPYQYDSKTFKHFDMDTLEKFRRRPGSNDDKYRRRMRRHMKRAELEKHKGCVSQAQDNLNPTKRILVKTQHLKDPSLTQKEKEDLLKIIELQNKGILKRLEEGKNDCKRGVELVPEIIPTNLLKDTLYLDQNNNEANLKVEEDNLRTENKKQTVFYEIYNKFSNRLSDYLIKPKCNKEEEKKNQDRPHSLSRQSQFNFQKFRKNLKRNRFNRDISASVIESRNLFRKDRSNFSKVNLNESLDNISVGSTSSRNSLNNLNNLNNQNLISNLTPSTKQHKTYQIRKVERGGIIVFNGSTNKSRRGADSNMKNEVDNIQVAKKFSKNDSMKISQRIQENAAKFIQTVWRDYIGWRKWASVTIQSFWRGNALRAKIKSVLYYYYWFQNNVINLEKLINFKIMKNAFQKIGGDKYLGRNEVKKTLKCIVLLQRSYKKFYCRKKEEETKGESKIKLKNKKTLGTMNEDKENDDDNTEFANMTKKLNRQGKSLVLEEEDEKPKIVIKKKVLKTPVQITKQVKSLGDLMKILLIQRSLKKKLTAKKRLGDESSHDNKKPSAKKTTKLKSRKPLRKDSDDEEVQEKDKKTLYNLIKPIKRANIIINKPAAFTKSSKTQFVLANIIRLQRMFKKKKAAPENKKIILKTKKVGSGVTTKMVRSTHNAPEELIEQRNSISLKSKRSYVVEEESIDLSDLTQKILGPSLYCSKTNKTSLYLDLILKLQRKWRKRAEIKKIREIRNIAQKVSKNKNRFLLSEIRPSLCQTLSPPSFIKENKSNYLFKLICNVQSCIRKMIKRKKDYEVGSYHSSISVEVSSHYKIIQMKWKLMAQKLTENIRNIKQLILKEQSNQIIKNIKRMKTESHNSFRTEETRLIINNYKKAILNTNKQLVYFTKEFKNTISLKKIMFIQRLIKNKLRQNKRSSDENNKIKTKTVLKPYNAVLSRKLVPARALNLIFKFFRKSKALKDKNSRMMNILKRLNNKNKLRLNCYFNKWKNNFKKFYIVLAVNKLIHKWRKFSAQKRANEFTKKVASPIYNRMSQVFRKVGVFGIKRINSCKKISTTLKLYKRLKTDRKFMDKLFNLINRKHINSMSNLYDYFVRWLKVLHAHKMKKAINTIIPLLRKNLLQSKLKKKAKTSIQYLAILNRSSYLRCFMKIFNQVATEKDVRGKADTFLERIKLAHAYRFVNMMRRNAVKTEKISRLLNKLNRKFKDLDLGNIVRRWRMNSTLMRKLSDFNADRNFDKVEKLSRVLKKPFIRAGLDQLKDCQLNHMSRQLFQFFIKRKRFNILKDALHHTRKRLRLVDFLYTVSNKVKNNNHSFIFQLLCARNNAIKKAEKDKKFLELLYKQMHLNYLYTAQQYMSMDSSSKEREAKGFDAENLMSGFPLANGFPTQLHQDYKRNIYSFKWYEGALNKIGADGTNQEEIDMKMQEFMKNVQQNTSRNNNNTTAVEDSFEENMKYYNPQIVFAKNVLKKSINSSKDSSSIHFNDSSINHGGMTVNYSGIEQDQSALDKDNKEGK